MTRILPLDFIHDDDSPDAVRVTATVAASVVDETYHFTFSSLRVGESPERPAAVSARLFARLEEEAAWAYEAAEASERRKAKQVDDIVSAARAHVEVML